MADRKAPQDNPLLMVDPTSEAWNKLPWRKLEQHVFRIQKRIYQASQRGNTRAVHKLQKLLMKSEAARLLAVRRVTQANQGKKTAGFDANSYGFRPGRSCHDAIAAILNHIRYKPKFVLDADIKGCFDNINQEALLLKLHTYSAMRHLIRAWLKAGVLEGTDFSPTETGTPQGGVVTPPTMWQKKW